MKKENDFGRDSIPLLVLKISIPFMIAQFVNVFYSIVDRSMWEISLGRARMPSQESACALRS